MPFPGLQPGCALLVCFWKESRWSHKLPYKISFSEWKRHFLTSWLLCIFTLSGFFFSPLCFMQRLALLWLGRASEANPVLTLLRMNKKGTYCIFTPEKRFVLTPASKYQTARSFCFGGFVGGGMRGPVSSQAGKLQWSGVVLSLACS